ncbi:MAG: N-acetyltransferase family protein [Haloferacaceae archaeon]
MRRQRGYPDEPVGPFPTPPRTITDAEGREVRIRAVGAGDDAIDAGTAREELTEMYLDFAPSDRAQGLPPTGEQPIRDWLDELLTDEAYDVVATVGDEVVGHAVVVPGTDADVYELAIFVHHEYQEAGIGTALLRTLLGYAAAEGVTRVWLTVERWNTPAINLYEKVGFEVADTESFELEMSIRLARPDD